MTEKEPINNMENDIEEFKKALAFFLYHLTKIEEKAKDLWTQDCGEDFLEIQKEIEYVKVLVANCRKVILFRGGWKEI